MELLDGAGHRAGNGYNCTVSNWDGSALEAVSVDQRDVTHTASSRTFRVYFWHKPLVDGLKPEEVGAIVDEWRLTDVVGLSQLLSWIDHHRIDEDGNRREAAVYVEVPSPDSGIAIVLISGSEPD